MRIFALAFILSSYFQNVNNQNDNHNYLRNQRELKPRARAASPFDKPQQQKKGDFTMTVETTRCNQKDVTAQEIQTSDDIYIRWQKRHPCYRYGRVNPLCGKSSSDRASLYFRTVVNRVIKVHFHIIHSGLIGDLSDSKILDSINVLNQAYSPYFTFDFDINTDVTKTENSAWFNLDSDDDETELRMKSALRRGDCSELNIYSVGIVGGVMGWATFPWSCSSNEMNDGVVILDETVPNGNKVNYNGGDTLVHEVGHWLGLWHTFQGGCSSGDEVADTPPEASPASGCPEGRDSCPNQPGLDPIHNYMDYSYDSCMDHFTNGQYARMVSQWEQYRNIVSNPTISPKPSKAKTQNPSSTPSLSLRPSASSMCPSGQGEVQIQIVTDDYGFETSWTLENKCTNTIILQGPGEWNPYSSEQTITIIKCIPVNQQYSFIIYDAANDGLCCAWGEGSYHVKFKRHLIKSGGLFDDREETIFGSCKSNDDVTSLPSLVPSSSPSMGPSVYPTLLPSMTPSVPPSSVPPTLPSVMISFHPSSVPSLTPSRTPSLSPSAIPSLNPSSIPSLSLSFAPSHNPSSLPSLVPSLLPSMTPSVYPSLLPSMKPSVSPSLMPSVVPSSSPSVMASLTPSQSLKPSISTDTSELPSISLHPSFLPSLTPSRTPSLSPSAIPSLSPSSIPSLSLSFEPSRNPSSLPSLMPTSSPSMGPSVSPSILPSMKPSVSSSSVPSVVPSSSPSVMISFHPSFLPSLTPSRIPSLSPSAIPSLNPSSIPSLSPSLAPSHNPSLSPTSLFSQNPSLSLIPSQSPTDDTPNSTPSFCSSGKSRIQIKILTDEFASETKWSLTNLCSLEVVLQDTGNYASNQLYTVDKCIPSNAEYSFSILDKYGDGICCSFGEGYYDVTYNGNLLKQGGEFESIDSVTFGLCDVTCDNEKERQVDIVIATDYFGDETSWELINNCTQNVVMRNEAPLAGFQAYHIKQCLPRGQMYTFVIKDDYGDGICCDNGMGSYTVSYDGSVVKEGGEFEHFETVTFGSCDSSPSPSTKLAPTSTPTLSLQPTWAMNTQVGVSTTLRAVSSGGGVAQQQQKATINNPLNALQQEAFCNAMIASIIQDTISNQMKCQIVSQTLIIDHLQLHFTISISSNDVQMVTDAETTITERLNDATSLTKVATSLQNSNFGQVAIESSLVNTPSSNPTLSVGPSEIPSNRPSSTPSESPSKSLTESPTKAPTKKPTKAPTKEPTKAPTKNPANKPTKAPTKNLTKEPTKAPTKNPTNKPTQNPTKAPTKNPTKVPTKAPTKAPTKNPTNAPTKEPSEIPTKTPTSPPTPSPTPPPRTSLNPACSKINQKRNKGKRIEKCKKTSCCIWNKRRGCIADTGCSVVGGDPPTSPPQPPISSSGCGSLTSAKKCYETKKYCCKWKERTCMNKSKCKNCSKKTKKGEKKCLEDGCCEWSRDQCKNKSICPGKRRKKRNKQKANKKLI